MEKHSRHSNLLGTNFAIVFLESVILLVIIFWCMSIVQFLEFAESTGILLIIYSLIDMQIIRCRLAVFTFPSI